MKLHRVAAIATTALVTVAGAFSVRSVLAQSSSDARIRVAHFSPDAPAIDIYIDGKKRLTNVPYEGVSDYLSLALGSHTFEVRATGTTPDSPSAFKTTADLEANSAYTVAAVGKIAKLQGKVYKDNLTPPGPGKAKVRILHGAPDVGPVDGAVKGGQVLFPKLTFPNASAYAEVTAGTYDLEARKAGTKDTILQAAVPLEPGSIYTIAAIGGGPQSARLKLIRDLDGGQSLPPQTAKPVPTRTFPPTTTRVGGGPASTGPPIEPVTLAGSGTPTLPEDTVGSGSSGTQATSGGASGTQASSGSATTIGGPPSSPTTTGAKTTTTAKATTTATTVASTTTLKPTTTRAPTTTLKPTTTLAATTTLKPTTTLRPTTTRAAPTTLPATTLAPTTLPATTLPATTLPPTTPPATTEAVAVATEPAPAETEPAVTQPPATEPSVPQDTTDAPVTSIVSGSSGSTQARHRRAVSVPAPAGWRSPSRWCRCSF